MFRRFLAAALVLAVAGALLVTVWPQLFGVQRNAFVAQVVSLRGLGTVAGLLLVVVLVTLAMLSRFARRLSFSLAMLLLAFAGMNVAVLATRGFGSAEPIPAGPGITVLSWNTLGAATSAEAVANLALEAKANVVALPETSQASAEQIASLMAAAGQPMAVHTTAFDQIAAARSTSLLIGADLGEYSITDGPSTSVLPSVVAEPDSGDGPTIIAVHAVSPTGGEMANWRSDLSWLAAACGGDNVIMAGDFNATIDHMARLGSTPESTLGNCSDAATTARSAAVGTWPTFLPAVLGAPIDHVMATAQWRVSGAQVVEDRDHVGSDHRPIVVKLRRDG